MSGERRKSNWVIWVVVILVIALLAVFAVPGIISMIRADNSSNRRSSAGDITEAPALQSASTGTGGARGSYETVTRGNLQVTVYGSGSLSPQKTHSVYNDSEGKIESILVEAGDTVQEGDILVRLSSSDIESNIKTYEKNLFTAQVELSNVRDTGSDYYVYAPSAGTLKQILCEEGDDVASIMKQYGYLAIISRDDKMRIEFGDRVSVWIDTLEVQGIVEQTVGLGSGIAVTIPDDSYEIGREVLITTIQGTRLGSGTLEINMPVPITAIGGTVDTVYYEEGESVGSGSKLFYTTGRLPSSDLQSALLSYEEARTALDNEKEKQDNLIIRAPIDGVVTSVNTSEGVRLEESTSLVTLQSATLFQVKATVDELDIVNVKVGQTVQVEIDAYDGEQFTGTVSRISGVGVVSGGVATYEVTVQMDEDPRLKDGMTASIEIVVADKQNVLLVPVEAIATSDGQKYVTLSNGLSTTVTTGASNDDYVEIISGVSEGDSVLITRDGSDSSDIAMPGSGMPGVGMPGGGIPGGMGGNRGGGMPGIF
jgi:HlyD family secretion protein